LGVRNPSNAARELQVLSNCQFRVEYIVLRAYTNLLPNAGRVRSNVRSADESFSIASSVTVGDHCRQQRDERRFAGCVGAQKAETLTCFHCYGDTVYYVRLKVTVSLPHIVS
jgi:hypothetical protein